jgi:hypothetical protein
MTSGSSGVSESPRHSPAQAASREPTRWGSREHASLRRARINAVQVEQGFKGDQLGPFLLAAQSRRASSGVVGVRDWAISGTSAWWFSPLCLRRKQPAGGAPRRRRRSLPHLALDRQPVKALFGRQACGNPPGRLGNFAAYAIVLLVLA